MHIYSVTESCQGGSKHACFQEQTAPPLFLASDIERRLLMTATEVIYLYNRNQVILSSLQCIFRI
jgi:hypothetical protein